MSTGNQFRNLDGAGCLFMIFVSILIVGSLMTLGFIFSPT